MPRGSPPLGFSPERDAEVKKRDSSPPMDFGNGFATSDRIRLRPGWFGTVIAEQLVHSYDGTRRWEKLTLPIEIVSLLEAGRLQAMIIKAVWPKVETKK